MSDANESTLSPEFAALYRELVTIRLTLQHSLKFVIQLLILIAVILSAGLGVLGFYVIR